TRNAKQVEMGFKSQVAGDPALDPAGIVDKRALRFMEDGAAWCWIAMDQAIRDAGLEKTDISNERTGLIVGTGGSSTRAVGAAAARGGRGRHAREGLAAPHRSVRGAEGDELDRIGDARHRL